MSMALLFLILSVVSAALAVVFYAAMNNDPAPGVSGHIVPLVVFGCAAPCLLVLSLLAWVVSVTMAVL